jgi:hypothetical protein
MANLGGVYWDVIKGVFRYFWVTFEYSLGFHGYFVGPHHSVSIHRYVDWY